MKSYITFIAACLTVLTPLGSCDKKENVLYTGEVSGRPASLIYNDEEQSYKLKIDYSKDDKSLWKTMELYVDSTLISKDEDKDLNILFENRFNPGKITAKNKAEFTGTIYDCALPSFGIWNYPDSTYEALYSPEEGDYFVYEKTFNEDFPGNYNLVRILMPSDRYAGINMNYGVTYFENAEIAAFIRQGEHASIDVIKYKAMPDWQIDSTAYEPIIYIENGLEMLSGNNWELTIAEINENINWMVAFYNLLDIYPSYNHSYREYTSSFPPRVVDSDCNSIMLEIPWSIEEDLFTIARSIRKQLGNEISDRFKNQVWFKNRLSYLRAVEQYLRYDIQLDMRYSKCKAWEQMKLRMLIPEKIYNSSYLYAEIRRIVNYDNFVLFLANVCLNDLLVQVSQERDRLGDSSYVIK